MLTKRGWRITYGQVCMSCIVWPELFRTAYTNIVNIHTLRIRANWDCAAVGQRDSNQGCQVWPFRGQKMTNLVYFILIGLEILKNLLSI